MMRYTWKRILTGIVSLFLLATVTFFLVRLIPGSPFQRGGVSEQVVEAVEEEYGLNDPLIEQYLSYMGNLLKGDLGISYQDPGTSVEEIIGRAAPLTVSLGLSALIVSVIVGTGCGVFYAASEKRAVKKVIGSLGMLAAAKIDGISGIRILFRHLLPNALGMIVVNFLFLIPQAIFTEAFLSFLGVGLSAPTASLGTLIQEGRDRMILYPCELLAPLITLCVLLVVFHILAMAMERRGGQTD